MVVYIKKFFLIKKGKVNLKYTQNEMIMERFNTMQVENIMNISKLFLQTAIIPDQD